MLRPLLLAVTALCLTLRFAYLAFDSPARISPQACRMSWMSPSYALQTGFNASWTTPSLAARYRLMLYREVGWDEAQVCLSTILCFQCAEGQKPRGIPVLFIPGNAGSGHQVRSIASSASRQYYASPSQVKPEFLTRHAKPLDFYAGTPGLSDYQNLKYSTDPLTVDFNEDLSAFHGPTLEAQTRYSADATRYILSLYPEGTQIILMGHSMGGLVATSLLPSSHISAVITMSTPHSVPPARFDSRMDSIYSVIQEKLIRDSTPILSICGGVTDTMIPSEFCTLPRIEGEEAGLRKTIFTSSLEGCWTGVGHREMVWCHQVRWQVARALLDITAARDVQQVSAILSSRFSNGIPDGDMRTTLEAAEALKHQTISQTPVEVELPLTLHGQQKLGSFKLSIPKRKPGSAPTHLTVYLSQGKILEKSPANPIPLEASLRTCYDTAPQYAEGEANHCEPLLPSVLRLIPNPRNSKNFSVATEGVDESDGVVVFRADVSHLDEGAWILLEVKGDASPGWLAAAVEEDIEAPIAIPTWGALYLEIKRYYDANESTAFMLGTVTVRLDPKLRYRELRFSHLMSNVLFVYRLEAKLSPECKGAYYQIFAETRRRAIW